MNKNFTDTLYFDSEGDERVISVTTKGVCQGKSISYSTDGMGWARISTATVENGIEIPYNYITVVNKTDK